MLRPTHVLVLAALAAGPAHALSAEGIVRKHVAATGGEKRLRAIETTRLAGTLATPDGTPGKFLWLLQRPDRFFAELQTPRGTEREAYNGRTGWREDGAGLRTLGAAEQAALRFATLCRSGRLVDRKKDKLRLRLAGSEPVAGRKAWVVELTSRGGDERRAFFDAESFLLVQEEHGTGPTLERVRYANHRPVDGIVEPQRITLWRDGTTFEVALDEVAHGVVHAAGTFDFPASATAGIPDLAALLEAVEQNQKEVERVTRDYTYDVLHTEFKRDAEGSVREEKREEYEVFQVRGRTLRRLVRKDGRELTPQEERKERARIDKLLEESAAAEPRAGDEADDDDLQVSDFLRICRFVNARRERFGGREVLVVEFEPRPGYVARNRSEALVQSFAGAVWIDEAAKQVVRLEARMLEGFKVGGGLVARLHEGSAFVFEQALVNDEVWLPAHAEVHASGRVLLVKGIRVDVVERFGNYRKFAVETRVEEAAPPE